MLFHNAEGNGESQAGSLTGRPSGERTVRRSEAGVRGRMPSPLSSTRIVQPLTDRLSAKRDPAALAGSSHRIVRAGWSEPAPGRPESPMIPGAPTRLPPPVRSSSRSISLRMALVTRSTRSFGTMCSRRSSRRRTKAQEVPHNGTGSLSLISNDYEWLGGESRCRLAQKVFTESEDRRQRVVELVSAHRRRVARPPPSVTTGQAGWSAPPAPASAASRSDTSFSTTIASASRPDVGWKPSIPAATRCRRDAIPEKERAGPGG